MQAFIIKDLIEDHDVSDQADPAFVTGADGETTTSPITQYLAAYSILAGVVANPAPFTLAIEALGHGNASPQAQKYVFAVLAARSVVGA